MVRAADPRGRRRRRRREAGDGRDARRAERAAELRARHARRVAVAVVAQARLARQALRAAPQRRAAKATMRSKSTTEAEFAEALKPRRAPRVDPNSWAHRRRAQIRSAERRRRLRQTE